MNITWFEQRSCHLFSRRSNKSGKSTEGLPWFYNGCASRAEKGLEGIALALVDRDEHTAYAIDIVQTPAELPEKQSRVDVYLALFEKHVESVREHTRHLLVDGGFSAHQNFADGVIGVAFLNSSRIFLSIS